MATITPTQYWANMKDKAAMHMATVAEKHEPESEHEVKEHLACVLKHGTCRDAAEMIIEAVEWQVSHLMEGLHEAAAPSTH